MAWATLVFTGATAIALILSGGFLGWQAQELAKQSKRANDRAAFDAYQTAMRDIDSAMANFLRWPDLRKYFFGGVKLPKDETIRAQVTTVGEALLDALAGGVHAAELALADGDDPMRRYAFDILASSPLLRAMLNDHPHWWPRLGNR